MSVVPLQDAKDFLNIRGTSQDSELQGFLLAAESVVSNLTGPLGPTATTETIFDPQPRSIVLASTPVVSVQSVSISPFLGQDPTDDTASWILDARAGILRRRLTGGYWGYYGPGSVATVAYTYGRAVLPDDLHKAVLFVLEPMWASQRGASPLPAGSTQEPSPGPGYLIPAKAMEAMLPYLKPPGLA